MRIKLIANPTKSWAKDLSRSLSAALKARHRIVRSGADATICIGGDGTILYASHKGRLEGTVLGIGTRHSYICQLDREDAAERILPFLDSAKSRPIMTLRGELGGGSYDAMNDFVVHTTNYRVVDIALSASGVRWEYEGDGAIISTSLGSASYAYSAGGERLSPYERKISLVPICPYKRAFKPTIIDEGEAVELEAGSNCAFIVDGIFLRNLKKGESLKVRRGEDITLFDGVGRDGWQ